MIIRVPNDMKESFFGILNLAQGSFTLEEEKRFTGKERKCLKFVRKLLGDDVYTPFTSRKEILEINKNFQKFE